MSLQHACVPPVVSPQVDGIVLPYGLKGGGAKPGEYRVVWNSAAVDWSDA